MCETSYLYLPASEKGLIQGHGRPNRFFVCKLNISKPVEQNNQSYKDVFYNT